MSPIYKAVYAMGELFRVDFIIAINMYGTASQHETDQVWNGFLLYIFFLMLHRIFFKSREIHILSQISELFHGRSFYSQEAITPMKSNLYACSPCHIPLDKADFHFLLHKHLDLLFCRG